MLGVFDMLISDIVYNDEIEFSSNWKLFENLYESGERILWDTEKDGWRKPPYALLDREISFIGIEEETLILGCKKEA